MKAKKSLLVALALAVGVIAILAVASPGPRFRLESNSPSGQIHVQGLRFKGKVPHALDGTLRLFVTHQGTVMKQQTSIPWGRDLEIKWESSRDEEGLMVEKGGRALMEFRIGASELKCIKGEELLAEDPYLTDPPIKR